MNGMSAGQAKRVPKQKATSRAACVYTINGTKYTLAEVVELVKAYDPTAVVSPKKLRARLERGHRDIKVLAADKLPAYTPEAMRK